MFVNHHSRQVTAKIVYYGPGLSGKTTNLQYIFSVTNPKTRGELVSIQTDIERTLFFDLLPINVGLVNGYQAKFQLYTVPGQVFYDSTRQLVLKGADGIVFVADSQEVMEKANQESFENLKTNLAKYNQTVDELCLVFQFNKRDLKNVLPIDILNRKLNRTAAPYYGATAVTGTGVIETLREVSSMTLRKIKGLLDQGLQAQTMKPFVNFDTDQRHGIIKKDELPFKKVTGKTGEFALKTTTPDATMIAPSAPFVLPTRPVSPTPPTPPKPQPPPMDGFDDDEFPGEPFPDIDDLPVEENVEEEDVLELTEYEQVVDEKANSPVLEKSEEIPELKGFDEEEIQIELGEMSGYDIEPVKPVKTDKIPKAERIETSKAFEKTEEILKPKISEPQKTPKELEKTAFEIDIENVELLKMQLPPKSQDQEMAAKSQPQPNEMHIKPQANELAAKPQNEALNAVPKPNILNVTPRGNEISAKPQSNDLNAKPRPNQINVTPKASEPESKSKPNEFEFLDKLRDESRLTFIRKMILLPGPDSPMVIEVRDKSDKSLLLEPLEIKITPGIKKITLILDIK